MEVTMMATATKEAKFDIQVRKIDTIRRYEANPRINDDAVDAVAATWHRFPNRDDVLVRTIPYNGACRGTYGRRTHLWYDSLSDRRVCMP
jgi:hypothetical protein